MRRLASREWGFTSLNGEPAQRYIEAKGGELALGRSVSSVLVNDGRVSGLKLSNGDLLEGDAYKSALPHKTLLESPARRGEL